MAEPESAMANFFAKYKENEANLDTLRSKHPARGGLFGLAVESPYYAATNIGGDLLGRVGRGAESVAYGAMRFGANLGAGIYRAKGNERKATDFAAAAQYWGEAQKTMPVSSPKSDTPVKTDDGKGGDGKTPGYDAIMKRLDSMDSYMKGAGMSYQQPNVPSVQVPSSNPQPSQVPGSSSSGMSRKDAQRAAMYYSALAYGMKQ